MRKLSSYQTAAPRHTARYTNTGAPFMKQLIARESSVQVAKQPGTRKREQSGSRGERGRNLQSVSKRKGEV
jgi:hypothetical protein